MRAGAWINGSIELTKPIAEGAMGRVWVGFHHQLQTHVAIKFVSEKLGDDAAEALARFEREARLAAQIRTPHVVRTFESGFTGVGVPYIVMEFLTGETLGDRLRRTGTISLDDATTVLTQTADGLTKAHELGIIHRDIKPDNIFLCDTQRGIFCKVLDFGIAKQTLLPAMGGLTTDGKMVGTPEYMSPEQVLEDRAVDYRADLWSLAVVMYQSLTGHLPFQGATLGQLCLNLVGKKPPKPTKYRPDLPPRIDAWFGRALNRDAQMRFTSATQMAESFATLDDDMAFHMAGLNENTERHLSSTHTPEIAPRKSNTMLTAAGMAAAVMVLGGGSWLATQPAAEPLVLAQTALEPMVNAAADRAVREAEAKPAAPSAETAVPSSEPSPSASPDMRRSPVPRTAPAPRTEAAPKPKPAAEPDKPKPAPAPSPGRRRSRTTENTGF